MSTSGKPLPCPSCKFDEVEYKAYVERMLTKWQVKAKGYDEFSPLMYKLRLTGDWVVECQNCGMSVLFGDDEAETLEKWNLLPRGENNG